MILIVNIHYTHQTYLFQKGLNITLSTKVVHIINNACQREYVSNDYCI